MAWAHLLNAHQLRLSHLQPRTVSTPVDTLHTAVVEGFNGGCR